MVLTPKHWVFDIVNSKKKMILILKYFLSPDKIKSCEIIHKLFFMEREKNYL